MKKILIVEDDRKIALVVFLRLKAQGYAVYTAADTEAGLKLALQHRPDLVILDISLPTRSGLNLAAQLQSLPMTAATPMIVMTASRIPAFAVKAAELGAAAFIEKPFHDGELITAVQRALSGASPATAPAEGGTPVEHNAEQRP
jgi:DNA-binding response OmpR family regulator